MYNKDSKKYIAYGLGVTVLSGIVMTIAKVLTDYVKGF